MSELSITDILQKQRNFFQTGKTKNVDFRIAQLKNLKNAINEEESAINQGLKADLNKSEFESYISEIVLVKKEIDYALQNLKHWAKPRKAAVDWQLFPASAEVYPEALGVVLIIGAWNYPFQLTIAPLLGAIAAGNCAIVKPSEIAQHTSNVVASIISKYFDANYIAVVEGGAEISQKLLQEKFDHIFFTGGMTVGKIIMEAAAAHLTPVTLELGGKSPCIVDSDINLEHTARRLTWGKFLNAGQTCIAPDYLLVDKRVKDNLLDTIQKCIQEFYGEYPERSPDYGRIVSQKHFERLVNLLKEGKISIGGQTNASERYIAPTVIEHLSETATVMQEEIFGPILPVIEYTNISEAIALINSRPKPLALYLFSRDRHLQKRVLQETSSGGVCINDTALQFAVSTLPFGGVGDSGIGSYHGKASFDTFSHYKSILKNPLFFDLKLRYLPSGKKLPLLKRVFG